MSNHHRFAIVTGASSGIGVAYAERMAERGYDLILVARRRDRLEDVARRIEIKTKRTVEIVIADLADAKDLLRIEALLTEREDIDVLINNAGLGALGPTSKVTADALENLIKINILALTRLNSCRPAGLPAAQFRHDHQHRLHDRGDADALRRGLFRLQGICFEFHALAPDGACQDKHHCSGGTSRSGSHRVF